MSIKYSESEANDDFSRVRFRETLNRMFSILSTQRQELLSFEEVKSLLQPKSQSYRGLQVVEVRLIVGSEGRYHDFDRHFMPRHDNMKYRWVRVDQAHLEDVILPPIKLFELGGVYFVRDGNHRVSVARAQGIERIDAEVVSLNAEISLAPDMGRENLNRAVIQWEREQFQKKTRFDKLLPGVDLQFTTTGQYDEVLSHIYVHKYFVNQDYEEELPFYYALISWYETVYLPILEIIRDEGLLSRFRGRTEADLYVWIVKHWHYLKENRGDDVSPRDAAASYSEAFGRSRKERMGDRLRKFWKRLWNRR